MTTPSLWMPGAAQQRKYVGGQMIGGPAHAVEHITWDQLNPDNTRAVTIQGVANYLESKGYAPTMMIDPFTGDAIQFYLANEGASALINAAGGVETNNEGSVCIQCEWLFTPGMVWEGRTYHTLADTPMVGLAVYLAWCESWGVPSVWAEGEPDFNSQRDSFVWTHKAGHYGHSQVPENDHTDPGPMPMFSPTQISPDQGDDDVIKIVHCTGKPAFLWANGKATYFGSILEEASVKKMGIVTVGVGADDYQHLLDLSERVSK